MTLPFPVGPTHTPASFLVMAILIQLTRTRAPICKHILSSLLFRRHGLIRRSMASDPTTPSEVTRFDFLVIGGGSGGLASARRASELGAATAVIESHKLGGTCVSKNNKTLLSFPTTVTVLSPLQLSHAYMSVARFNAKPPDSFCGSFLFTTNIVGSLKRPSR